MAFTLGELGPGQALAGSAKSFVETFDSTTYRDGITTSADWAGTGQLDLFPFEHELIGSNMSVTGPWDLAVDGDHAFVADGSSGLRILDITDPANPIIVGTWNPGGTCFAVDVSGDIAALCFTNNGFHLVDVSDPTAPALIAADPTGGYRDVAIVGTRAYATTTSSLVIWDLSSLPALTQLGSVALSSGVEGIDVEGDFAYIAQGRQFTSINVSDPTAPIGWASIGGFIDATGVDIHGDVAYVGDLGQGVVTIDISDPGNLVYGNVAGWGSPSHLRATGDHLYVAGGSAGLASYNISDPLSPLLVATYDTPGFARSVAPSGYNVFLADGSGGFRTINIATSPANFLLDGGTVVTGGNAQSVAQNGNTVIVGQGGDGFALVSIADPNAPVVLADVAAEAFSVAIQGDEAFVLGGNQFSIYDITDPSSPVLRGSTGGGSSAFATLAVEGGYAYYTHEAVGVWWFDIVDISDSDFPFVTNSTPVGFGAMNDIVLAGEYAFVADDDGLIVLDITDPASVVIFPFVTPANLNSITISGNYAYCTRGNDEISVFDISDPTAAVHLGTGSDLYPGATGRNLDIEGNYLYGADDSVGLDKINVTDPANPSLILTHLFPALDIDVDGQFAVRAGGYEGLRLTGIDQRDVDESRNVAASLEIFSSADPIIAGRIVLTPDVGATRILIVDGNSVYSPNGAWREFTAGNTLGWKLYIEPNSIGVPPAIDNVRVDWLYEYPVIDSITDLGNDQGRQVRLEWTRSGYESVTAAEPVTEYSIYRRVDSGNPQPNEPGADSGSPSGLKLAGWDYLTTVPAELDDRYSIIVPTVADSTQMGGIHYSTFLVRARTASLGVLFESPPDSGYSVDNLAPGVPVAVLATYHPTSVDLSWDDAPETDFQYYRVYRGADPGFVPSPGNLVHETAVASWSDPTTEPWGYHYKITTLDHAGNESEAASPATVSGVSTGETPAKTTLHGAVPNPFNPSTSISFELATPGPVKLRIYDAAGRFVATLVDGHREVGRHRVVWDGRDSAGRMSAAGVYIYRLETRQYTQAMRMTLIK